MDSPEDNKPTQTIIAKEGSTIKNVIQAIIHLPGWAWIIGVVIISVALLLVSAVFNVEPLQALLPTPTAFAAATEGQSLIIVADFENRSGGKYEGIDPAQYVYEQLLAQVQKDNLDIRVERLRQIVDDNSAKPAGETYKATLVIWGWYDALTITPRIKKTSTLTGISSDQENSRFSLTDSDNIEFNIVTDLPSQTTYLVMFTLGIDKFSQKNYDLAFIYFDKAISNVTIESNLSANPSESYFYRGFIYSEREDYKAAIIDYTKSIELDVTEHAGPYLNRGIAYKNQGNYDLALADLNKSIEIDPKRYFAFAHRCDTFRYQKKYELAQLDCDKAIELRQDDSYAYSVRGFLHSDQNDHKKAIFDFSKAIELDPTDSYSYNGRGNSYRSLGEIELSIMDYNKAIELNPGYAFPYRNRGVSYHDQGKYELAIIDYNKAIELDPNYGNAYNSRGYTYSILGNYEEAIRDYSKAIEINPAFSTAYYNRGNAYYAVGGYEKAITDYTMVTELNPANSYIYYDRAFAYLALGDKENAIKDFEKFIELTTDSDLKQKAEEELKKLKEQ